MLPIILALFDRAPGDRSRPTALHGQFVVGGPSRSEVRSDLNIIVRRSGARWPPSPDEPGCLASRARTILSRTAQHLSYPPPLPPARAIPGAPLLSAAASLQGHVQILVKSEKIEAACA